MTDLFKLELRLDGESMTRFRSGIALLCVEFPAVTRSDILDLQSVLNIDPMPMDVIRSVLDRMLGNAETAVVAGDELATVIGMCEPVRIDRGAVQ